MSAAVYQVGQLVRTRGTFRDAAGALVDPDVVNVQVRTPAGAVTEYTAPDVVRDSTGVYHYDVDATVEGEWRYRFYSTGSGQTANEDSFTVEDSDFND